MNRLDNSPLFIAFLIFTLASYLFSTLAFIVSKWYAMYPGSQSTFQNIGLWEVCFNSFMNEDIYDQLFSDCFYINSPEIKELYNVIVKNWFLASQITYTFSFIGLMLATLLCVMMCLGVLNMKHRRNVFILLGFHSLSSVTCLATLILFGVNTKDLTPYQWIANPTQCSLSWSYGSASLSLLGSMICLGLLAHVLRFQHNNCILWSCGKKSKYEQSLANPDISMRSMSNIGASIYDPRGTSTESRISKNTNQPEPSLISTRSRPHSDKLSKNQNQPETSIMSTRQRPPSDKHGDKSSKVNRPAGPPGSSLFSEEARPNLYAKKPNKPAPHDSSVLSGKSDQNTNSKKFAKVSSPPASQLTVTSLNASSNVIAAKPMRRK